MRFFSILFFLFTLASTSSAMITNVVPFAPGGNVDATARSFAKFVKERANIDIITVNKPGAEGLIGLQFISSAPKDGQVIGFSTIYSVASVNLEFEYLSAISKPTMLLVVSTNIDVNNFEDLVQKLEHGKIHSFGVTGPANRTQIEQVISSNSVTESQIIVPYKGAGPALTDLLGGHINFAFLPAGLVTDLIKAGKLKVIASNTLHASFPDITVLPKQYKKWVDIGSDLCVISPKGMAPDKVIFWRELLTEYLNDSTIRYELEGIGSVPLPPGEEYLLQTIKRYNYKK